METLPPLLQSIDLAIEGICNCLAIISHRDACLPRSHNRRLRAVGLIDDLDRIDTPHRLLTQSQFLSLPLRSVGSMDLEALDSSILCLERQLANVINRPDRWRLSIDHDLNSSSIVDFLLVNGHF